MNVGLGGNIETLEALWGSEKFSPEDWLKEDGVRGAALVRWWPEARLG